jgi:hypothetical protein
MPNIPPPLIALGVCVVLGLVVTAFRSMTVKTNEYERVRQSEARNERSKLVVEMTDRI